MFTKEDLSSMKYKELVAIAKEYGVYKSRSKKVNLLNKLLSLPFEEVSDQQLSNNENDLNLVDSTQKTGSFNKMMSGSPAPLRRETFEIFPCTKGTDHKAAKHYSSNIEGKMLDINVPSNRRETFDIDKGENLSSAKTDISLSRQNTFSIDKPKKISDKTATPIVLRQGTFSIDKPSKNNIFEEMPGVICQEFKNTPSKPSILNETVTFSPVRTRNSLRLQSVCSARSIGQRIENQRSAKNERRPSSRGSKTQKNFSVNVVPVTPVRIHKTSIKGGRIEKKITPSKLPNFKAIHMREFSKMESIVEHTNRKAERTKALMTPLKLNPASANNLKGTSLVTSRIPIKFNLSTPVEKKSISTPRKGKDNMITHNHKNANLRKSYMSNVKDKLKFMDSPMTKVKRRSTSGLVVDIANKIASNPKKRLENVKEIVTNKIHPFSVERNRAKGRDFLQSVRMNRRFQLQMEVMRKAKA